MMTYIICDFDLQRHVDLAFSACKLMCSNDWITHMKLIEKGENGASRDILFGVPLGMAILDSNPDLDRLDGMAKELQIPCLIIAKDSPNTLNEWIVSLLLDDVYASRKDAGIARKDAAILRCNLEIQQQAFYELETAVNQFGMPLIRLALEWPIAVGTFRMSSVDDGEVQFSQEIPASARGLACIDIHCEAIDDLSEDSMFEMHIADLSGNHLTSSGARQLSSISKGWNRIPMLQPANCMDKDAMVVMTMQGRGAIDLSLAPAVPLSRFHLKQGSDSVSDTPIALKAWRGFAGLKGEPPHTSVANGASIRVSPREIGSASIYSCDDSQMGFNPVQYWPTEDGILVHPPATGMTVAVIEGLDLQNCSSVSAIVNNNNREASPLAFAIGLVPSGKKIDTSDILSTWLTLPPLAWGEVHAFADESHNGTYDLLMASIVASGNSNHKAWGLFRGFLLHNCKL